MTKVVGSEDLNDIDGPAYYLAFGERFPYDGKGEARDWAHRAARGVLAELKHRGVISQALDGVDPTVRGEIVKAMEGIILAAALDDWTGGDATDEGIRGGTEADHLSTEGRS